MKTSEMIKISMIIEYQKLTKVDGWIEKTPTGFIICPTTFKES